MQSGVSSRRILLIVQTSHSTCEMDLNAIKPFSPPLAFRSFSSGLISMRFASRSPVPPGSAHDFVAYTYMYINTHIHTHTHTLFLYIYIYTYIYIGCVLYTRDMYVLEGLVLRSRAGARTRVHAGRHACTMHHTHIGTRMHTLRAWYIAAFCERRVAHAGGVAASPPSQRRHVISAYVIFVCAVRSRVRACKRVTTRFIVRRMSLLARVSYIRGVPQYRGRELSSKSIGGI